LISPWFIDTGRSPVFPGEGNFQALNLYKDIRKINLSPFFETGERGQFFIFDEFLSFLVAYLRG